MSTPKSGIVVEAYHNGVKVSEVTTNQNGVALFSNIPIGIYVFRIKTPDGYGIDEGNIENEIIDANANNNFIKQYDLGAGVKFGQAEGVDVTKGATSRVTVVIGQSINLSMILTFNPATPTQYKIKFTSSSILTEIVTLTLSHVVRRDDGDGQMIAISQTYSSDFTIPIGAFESNEITINSGIDPQNPIQNGDVLDAGITAKSPGKTVVNLGVCAFIY